MMTMMKSNTQTKSIATTAAVVLTMSTLSSAIKYPLQLDKLPDTGEQWQSLKNGNEFQPAKDLSPLAQEHLRRLSNTEDDTAYATSEYEKLFVDGSETYYDEYAQAWRALGFYIDCDFTSDYDDQDGGDNQGSGGCQRFMLWAAYVDEGYSGNGVGEYQYWDRKNKEWSDKACSYEGSRRCVKMDCHLSDTHFSLLGFFKEPHYDEWMEQLFKHEGDCVWTDAEYEFMQGNREAWPTSCTQTMFSDTDDDGNKSTIYYDIKPMPYGEMGIGLYTDTDCIHEYGGGLGVDKVVQTMGQFYNESQAYNSGNNNGDGMSSLAQELQSWNKAFEVYKQCQPCKAYDLTKIVAGSGYRANTNGNRYDYYYANQNNGGDNYNNNANQNSNSNSNANDSQTISSSGSSWFSSWGWWGSKDEDTSGSDNGGDEQYAGGNWCQDAGGNVVHCNGGYRRLNNNNQYYQDNNYQGNQNYNYNQNYNNQYGDDGNNDEPFQCNDDAGYENVNQCMKFATHTKMMTASYRDVEQAGTQGSITLVQTSGGLNNSWAYGRGSRESAATSVGSPVGGQDADEQFIFGACMVLFVSSIVFAGSAFHYTKMKQEYPSPQSAEEQQLEKFQLSDGDGGVMS